MSTDKFRDGQHDFDQNIEVSEEVHAWSSSFNKPGISHPSKIRKCAVLSPGERLEDANLSMSEIKEMIRLYFKSKFTQLEDKNGKKKL
ncbi:hypothetical protein CHUAL_001636 [Chamberlinius hualienensis]